MARFDEKYTDVLQNIEFALMQTYRAHAEMTDWEAPDAVKALIRTYQAETRGRAAPSLKLNPLAQEAYDSIKMICDWRLGRAEVLLPEGQQTDVPMTTKTVEEIISCLKTIHSSIELWQKERGRRGYFDFVSQFVK
ncbi:MAG: hypothetical protein KGJ80_07635 [Chloroflexota bacterium]|nr:hypothetical protein [Chloroflexota bacterium]